MQWKANTFENTNALSEDCLQNEFRNISFFKICAEDSFCHDIQMTMWTLAPRPPPLPPPSSPALT